MIALSPKEIEVLKALSHHTSASLKAHSIAEIVWKNPDLKAVAGKVCWSLHRLGLVDWLSRPEENYKNTWMITLAGLIYLKGQQNDVSKT